MCQYLYANIIKNNEKLLSIMSNNDKPNIILNKIPQKWINIQQANA